MKTRIVEIVVVLVLASLTIYTFVTKPRIAYVESNFLMQHYDGVKDLNENLKRDFSQETFYVDSLKKTYQELMNEENVQDYNSQENNKKLEFLKKLNGEINYRESLLNKEINDKRMQYMQGIVDQMNKVVKEYASSKGYDLILGSTDYGNIVYSNEKYDITEEVLAALNEKYTE